MIIFDVIKIAFISMRERKKRIDQLLLYEDALKKLIGDVEESLSGRSSFTETIVNIDKRLTAQERVMEYISDTLNTVLLIVDRRNPIEKVYRKKDRRRNK